MFSSPESGDKEKEVYEADLKEAAARRFSGMMWPAEGIPPPDFVEVRVLGPRRATAEEARKDGCDLKRLAFRIVEKRFSLQEIWRRCYFLESKQWTELAGEDILETSESLVPEFIAAQQSKKETFESTAEWFQANNKRRDYEENFAPVGPSWAAVQAQTPVPRQPGIWYMHERQNSEGKHVPFLFFNAFTGKYYRNRSTEVTYVPAKSRWIQTGIPHSSEEHSMKMAHGSVCLPTSSGRKDDMAVVLPELSRTASLLKQPLPFMDKPAALFLLVDGLRQSNLAAEWCAKRLHTHLLPRLSAYHSEPEDSELVAVVREALEHLDHALLGSPARYAGCCLALALLLGRRLIICSMGGCRAVVCSPPAPPEEPVAKKGVATRSVWSCRAVEGGLPGHTRLEVTASQRRRRAEAYGPLDFEGRPGDELQAASASQEMLAKEPSDRDRAVRRALRAAHPYAALGLSLAEAVAAGAGKKAVEAFETLLGPGKGDLKTESARSRVKAAGEAIDRMLAQDIFGAQQLAELFYIMDEEGGIVSQQRAAALLALAPGCGEAVANGAVQVRYQAVLSGLSSFCPQDASRGWEILREVMDAAARPATPLWTPPPSSRGVEVSSALGLRDLKRPRRLVGLEFSAEIFRIEPGSSCCMLLLTDGANDLTAAQISEAVAEHQGRPKAVATQLAAACHKPGSSKEGAESPALGILTAFFSLKAPEEPPQPAENEADTKKRKAPEKEVAVVVGPQPGGGMPNRIRVAHILMKWESLTAHDSNARRAARKGRTQADAEKELLKLLQVLNAMPHGTPAEGKKLSAKFAERLGFVGELGSCEYDSQLAQASHPRLCKAHSDCNSANNGHMADLGWIVPGQSDKDFEAAAFDLPVGAISDIVISQRDLTRERVLERRARIDLVRWDARRLPLRAFCADRLLLHPPAGKFFGSAQALRCLPCRMPPGVPLCRVVADASFQHEHCAAPGLADRGPARRSDTARAVADRALPAHAVGAKEGCIVRTSKDLGIAWVRHAETRLLFEGDASLLLLSTCVKPLRQEASDTSATEAPM
ncbi:ESS1 [Symbiodinium sp. CCMP2592]|nr:ESS1 [Symbiodinium sp. CCMP2592]